jgi:hypothetical protein
LLDAMAPAPMAAASQPKASSNSIALSLLEKA